MGGPAADIPRIKEGLDSQPQQEALSVMAHAHLHIVAEAVISELHVVSDTRDKEVHEDLELLHE